MQDHAPRILVIDDEPAMVDWVKAVLAEERAVVRAATHGGAAEELFRLFEPDVVLTDIQLPDIDGLELLKRFKQAARPVEVIVLTGHASIPRAVDAMRHDAFAFVEKPIEPDALLVAVRNAAEHCRLRQENTRLRQRVQAAAPIPGFIGRNPAVLNLLEMLRSVAPSEASCLIVGENGTGKELIANALHGLSRRARGPLIKVNCAAIPEELIEAELFGHRKGAFTGAIADKEGLFELANGGSIFLDEIGEMPAYLQTKLLRVLQERAYRAVGSERIVHLDIRVICATNADVQQAVRDGRLREDLYYRVNTVTFKLPPLRERTDDIPLLCQHFIERFREKYERDVRGVSADAMRQLLRYHWPGNVRELENTIERGLLLSKSNELQPEALPPHIREASGLETTMEVPPNLTLDEIERMAIVTTLRQTRWNKQEAAHILGLYRPTLYSKMRKHAIADPGRAARGYQA